MSAYELQELARVKKQASSDRQEHKREQQRLYATIENLESELEEYREKQIKTRKLNESILNLQHNQSTIEQFGQKQAQRLASRHNEELKRVKAKHQVQKKERDDMIEALKKENSELKLLVEKVKLDGERKLAELREDLEEQLKNQETDLNTKHYNQLEHLTDKLRMTEEMKDLYKQQLESSKSAVVTLQQQNQKPVEPLYPRTLSKDKHSQSNRSMRGGFQTDSVKYLNQRIDRVLAQVAPNRNHLDARIKQIRQRMKL